MKIASILILTTLLTTLLGGPQALAQEGGKKQEAERAQDADEKKQGQDAERTQKARDQKKAQNADRTKKAREQKQGQDAERTQKARDQKKGQDEEAERMKASRLERRANRPERAISGSRIPSRGAPQARAADVQKGAQGDAQRSERARRAKADEQRQQVTEFIQLVRDHRVRMAKISRLGEVYGSQGDKAKADRVRALQQRERQNFERIVARSRKQLGDEHYASVAKRLKLDD
jgi:hypothetical protein